MAGRSRGRAFTSTLRNDSADSHRAAEVNSHPLIEVESLQKVVQKKD